MIDICIYDLDLKRVQIYYSQFLPQLKVTSYYISQLIKPSLVS